MTRGRAVPLTRDEFPAVCETLRDHVTDLLDGRRATFTDLLTTTDLGGERYAVDIAGVAAHSEDGVVATVVLTLKPEHSPRRKKLLTEMDARILEGVAAGVPTNKLATMVDLSRGGVEYHVTNLLRKLKAPNRVSLVSKAYALGILLPGMWPPKVVPDFVI
jgi:DNA-binding CsgD family transcriptional regulator